MEQLPEELILHIASFLEATDILPLNHVSRRFLEISRDNELWKSLCFHGSAAPSRSLRHREGRYGGPIPIQEATVFALQRHASRSDRSVIGDASSSTRQEVARPQVSTSNGMIEGLASWDPKYSGEQVNWYNEYIARHAPLCMSWLLQPCGSKDQDLDIQGVGLLKRDNKDILVSPLGDASVCLWNLGHETDTSDSKAGQILSQSAPGFLSGIPVVNPSPNAVECVSIDQTSGRAYIASHSYLNEVDLTTLQRTCQTRFDNQICSLSEGGTHPNALTVGTDKSIHIYDPRVPTSPTSPASIVEDLDTLDAPPVDGFPDFHRLYSGDSSLSKRDHGTFAPVEPLPLSFVHLNHNIHVAGRFPSILNYDRRFFPQNMTSIYSGARISALTFLSHHSSTGPNNHTLVAAGEYKGKGSLELYPLSSDPSLAAPEPYRNRTSASRSKLLSLIPHGNRLLFSDSDGQLKWIERDGSTLVRRWNINNWSIYSSPDARSSIFNAAADEGDVARKLLALNDSAKSEVLVWTGEKVGIVGYGNNSRFAGQGKEDAQAESGEDEEYARMMRRALERQADEVRFVAGLGLGG